ncbi:uracil phosphoribosyltransferase [Lapidilactobacillus concavus]|uniref:CopY/TcrY family copper transport repressor n=1 Tax=Lapidilactobacillus concavus TaxID=287844 RepID=UPI000ADB54DD|nr:CopY/TcrY family copper transport repressor [Lapidilactobacillus concavus]GEL13441.1 uracil phosphoribosyltransferase [Lapidilactobacillus concavus]
MNETDVTTMTSSEWELMRIIWTLNGASSREVIDEIQRKRDWTESTIKTLLGRLVKKQMLTTLKEGHRFVYQPAVPETEAMDATVSELFTHLCEMKKGQVILSLIEQVTLSQSDLKSMQALITKKLETAPEQVACNCLTTGGTCENHCED